MLVLQVIVGFVYGFLIRTMIYPVLRTFPLTIGLVLKGVLRKTAIIHQAWSFVFALLILGIGAFALSFFTSAAEFLSSWGSIVGAVVGFVLAWMAPGGSAALRADYADFMAKHLAEPSANQRIFASGSADGSAREVWIKRDEFDDENYDEESESEDLFDSEDEDLEAEIERKNLEIERLETELEIRRLKAESSRIEAERDRILEESSEEWFEIIRGNDTEDREILSEIVSPSSPLKEGTLNWFFHRANIDLLNGDVESALVQYSKMIELEPRKHVNYYLRSRANLSIGNIYEFFDDYENAVQLANGEELPFLDVYELLNKMPDAMIDRISEKLRKVPLQAISIKKQSRETRVESLRVLKEQLNSNPQAGVNASQQLQKIEFSENTEEWYVQKALAHWQNGEREIALEYYDSALEMNPLDELTLLNRGNLLFELGYFDEAFEDLQKAVDLNPEVPAGLLMFKKLSPEIRETIRQNMMKENRSAES